MTVAGTISIAFPRGGIGCVASWLYAYGPFSPDHPEWPTASRIALAMFKCIRRRGRNTYWNWEISFSRQDAEWLATRLPAPPDRSTILYRSGNTIVDYAINFGSDLRWRLGRGRGRPRDGAYRLRRKIKANMTECSDPVDHLRVVKRWRAKEKERDGLKRFKRSRPDRQALIRGTILDPQRE